MKNRIKKQLQFIIINLFFYSHFTGASFAADGGCMAQ